MTNKIINPGTGEYMVIPTTGMDENTVNSLTEDINKTFKKLNSNVISDKEFKERTNRVFEFVSECLSKTLGPFGSTTILEQYGEMHITKDGFQVLKQLRFDNTIDNNILNLLFRISSQLVVKVGDGSTSSIVAADELLKQLKNIGILNNVRPKDFIDALEKCVNLICSKILESSKKINKEGNFEDIYNLAYISTNGDKEISSIIQDIYQKTQNGVIQYRDSKDSKTHHEIIEGYKGKITYLDAIFTNSDGALYNDENVSLLFFDHKIDLDYEELIKYCASLCATKGSTLVVVAPYYDNHLLNKISRECNAFANHNMKQPIVYTKVSLINNALITQYSDFIMMAGGTKIDEELFYEIQTTMNGKDEKNTVDEIIDRTQDLDKIINRSLGHVHNITISADDTLIQGFDKRSDVLYETHLNQATNEVERIQKDHENRSLVDFSLYNAKERLSRLTGKMGVIYVGGYTTLSKKATSDLVDDAIKACNSAYSYGYNIGGNLIIPVTIKKIIDELSELNSLEINILKSISDAFSNVFKKVLFNANIEDKESIEIFKHCVSYETGYDILTGDYTSTQVINSCMTDIEILKATSSIVSLLISSNQYITIDVTK